MAFTLMPASGRSSSASMMRLLPHAQQMSEPLFAAALPYRVVTSPLVGIILSCLANVSLLSVIVAMPEGMGRLEPLQVITQGTGAAAVPPPVILNVKEPVLEPTVMFTVTVPPLNVA